jgi:hypothetical protein
MCLQIREAIGYAVSAAPYVDFGYEAEESGVKIKENIGFALELNGRKITRSLSFQMRVHGVKVYADIFPNVTSEDGGV